MAWAAEWVDWIRGLYLREAHLDVQIRQGHLVVAMLVVIIVIYYRERSWRLDSESKLVMIHDLNTSVHDKTRLESADLIALERLWNMTASCSNVTFPDIYNSKHEPLDEASLIKKLYHPTLSDWKGLSMAVAMLSMILFESTYLHSTLLDAMSKEELITQKCFLTFKLSIQRCVPICHLLIFTLLLFASPLAWLGIFDRFAFVMLSAKGLLIWSWMLPLGYLIMNAARIISGLRKHSSDWKDWRIVFKDTYYLRVLFCLDKMDHFLPSYGVISIVWITVWPLSYSFYNSPNDNQIFSDSYTSYIYIINMLFHVSMAYVFWCYNFLEIAQSPPILKKSFMWVFSYCQRRFNVKSARSIFISAFAMLLTLSVVVAFFRIFWFIFISRACVTYYGVFVMLTFSVPILALSIISLQLLTTNLSKDRMESAMKEGFIIQFRLSLGPEDIRAINKDSNKNSNSSNSINSDTDLSNVDAAIDELWIELLRVSSIISVFDESAKEYSKNKATEFANSKKDRKKKPTTSTTGDNGSSGSINTDGLKQSNDKNIHSVGDGVNSSFDKEEEDDAHSDVKCDELYYILVDVMAKLGSEGAKTADNENNDTFTSSSSSSSSSFSSSSSSAEMENSFFQSKSKNADVKNKMHMDGELLKAYRNLNHID